MGHNVPGMRSHTNVAGGFDRFRGQTRCDDGIVCTRSSNFHPQPYNHPTSAPPPTPPHTRPPPAYHYYHYDHHHHHRIHLLATTKLHPHTHHPTNSTITHVPPHHTTVNITRLPPPYDIPPPHPYAHAPGPPSSSLRPPNPLSTHSPPHHHHYPTPPQNSIIVHSLAARVDLRRVVRAWHHRQGVRVPRLHTYEMEAGGGG